MKGSSVSFIECPIAVSSAKSRRVLSIRDLSVGGIALAAARHPRPVLLGWGILVAVSVVLVLLVLPGSLSPLVRFLTPVESQRADDALEAVRGPLRAQEAVVVSSPIYSVDEAAFREQVGALQRAALGLGPQAVESVLTYYDTGLDALRSPDGRATVMVVVLTQRPEQAARSTIGVLRRALAEASQEGFQVLMAGEASLVHDLDALAERDLRRAELVGVPMATVVLLLVFGSLAAAALPLAMAGVAIVMALGIVAVVGRAVDAPVFTINIVVTMGLAVGIDYALFVLSRYREERRSGVAAERAVEVVCATAVRAIFFSGLVVVLSLIGVMLVPFNVFVGLALGAASAVLVAILACLTLLPAILSVLKDRTSFLSLPVPRAVETALRGMWWSRIVLRRPAFSAAVGLAILLPMAAMALEMETGVSGYKTLPNELPAKKGFLALEERFSYGLASPVEVVVKGDLAAPSVQKGIEALKEALASHPDFASPVLVQPFPEKTVTVVTAPMRGDPVSAEAQAAVRRLRELVRQTFQGAPVEAMVTGEAARMLDYVEMTRSYAPLTYGLVLGLSAVLLMVAFRSVVLPFVAVVLNLFSVGAAYGLIALVFQRGWGQMVGLPQTEAVEVWIPLFLFALVFGLSMDYQVFLLSRVREHYGRTRDAAEAVARGLEATGSVITGAALIMVAVFAVMGAGELTDLRQAGLGLAFAIFVDATVVRLVLLPSILRLMGQRVWYLPPFLRWLPRFPLGHEG
jgi:RND superfamily putative drug exporter